MPHLGVGPSVQLVCTGQHCEGHASAPAPRAGPQRGRDPLPSCYEMPQRPDTAVFPRVMPRELEADGKQTVSLNDHKLQCQLCLHTERKAGGQEADRSLFPCPKQESLTRGQ